MIRNFVILNLSGKLQTQLVKENYKFSMYSVFFKIYLVNMNTLYKFIKSSIIKKCSMSLKYCNMFFAAFQIFSSCFLIQPPIQNVTRLVFPFASFHIKRKGFLCPELFWSEDKAKDKQKKVSLNNTLVFFTLLLLSVSSVYLFTLFQVSGLWYRAVSYNKENSQEWTGNPARRCRFTFSKTHHKI